jgi:hypothetical protein
MLKGIHLTLMMGPLNFEPVPRYLIDALTRVQVTSSAGQRNGFQLSFTVAKDSPIQRELLPFGFFDPPWRVVLVVTLNGTPNVLMDGVITRQELGASNEPGQSTLTITGLDVSQMMDLIDFSGFPWPALPAEARVAIMVAKYAMYGIVPIVIPSVLVDVPNPLDVIPKQKGTDLKYIKLLADEVGYVFYVESGPVPGVNHAYWGPEIKVGAVQPALSVNMDAHTNVESLSFSFDGISKSLYILYIQNPETGIPIPIPVPDIGPLNPPLGLKPVLPLQLKFLDRDLDPQTQQDGTAKYSPLQAASKALGMASQAADVIGASGTLDVLRYGHVLKARQLVGVRGAGRAYDGLYFVKSVTHTIQRGEYKQNFTLTRNAHVAFTERIAV